MSTLITKHSKKQRTSLPLNKDIKSKRMTKLQQAFQIISTGSRTELNHQICTFSLSIVGFWSFVSRSLSLSLSFSRSLSRERFLAPLGGGDTRPRVSAMLDLSACLGSHAWIVGLQRLMGRIRTREDGTGKSRNEETPWVFHTFFTNISKPTPNGESSV